MSLADGYGKVCVGEHGCVCALGNGAIGHGDFNGCAAWEFVGHGRGVVEEMIGGSRVCICVGQWGDDGDRR